MSISSISQWVASSLGASFSSIAPWQIGVATTVAAVALPCIIRLASSFCFGEPAELIHTWIVDGKQVHFYLTKSGKIQLEVIRQSDRAKLFKSGNLVIPPAYEKLPRFGKLAFIKQEIEPSGWQEDGAPLITLSKGDRLHSWRFEDQSISLISKGDDLLWKFVQGNIANWTKDLRSQNLSKAQRIEQLLTSRQPIKWNNQLNYPFLVEKFVSPVAWLFGNRKLNLVLRDKEEQPMWQLVNNTLKTTSWAPLDPELLSGYSREDRISRLQTQDIAADSIILESAVESVSLVQKISRPSGLDPQVIADNERWAVTLVDIGDCNMHYSTWGGHAAIVVEGVEENLPFTQICDLMPVKRDKAVVNIAECSLSAKIPFTGKKTTCLLTKEKVIKMMDSIRKERDETRLIEMDFNLRGIDAIFLTGKKGHNCFSWAREKLALAGLESTAGLIAYIATFPRQN